MGNQIHDCVDTLGCISVGGGVKIRNFWMCGAFQVSPTQMDGHTNDVLVPDAGQQCRDNALNPASESETPAKRSPSDRSSQQR